MAKVGITVPSVGESITEGTLARWLVASGSVVKSGDPLFELETDKASSVVPAPAAGVLRIDVAEGQTVAVGAAVGSIDPEGAQSPAARPTPASADSEKADERRGTNNYPELRRRREKARTSRSPFHRRFGGWSKRKELTLRALRPPAPAAGSPKATC